ncbi:MAG: bifunctional oligoribonuclease/PAP phosphatase NrnA [Lachnospiraceae bacterium]
MTLKDLEIYDPITIQCHDNPDADAIGSGYGLYCYFKSKGKDVRLVYSGRNQITKSNLLLMIDKLEIPIDYMNPFRGEILHVEGLLITVDCQYGAGNVTGISGDTVAIIDHHQVEIDNVENSLIVPALGSCCTLVWKLLTDEKFSIPSCPNLATALYYGLYTDTNQMAEIRNPLDMDMRDEIEYDKSLLVLFRNSNLSLRELEVAGIAMIRYSYNEDYGFAVIKSQPCDPNILGLISDFLLQVDVIKSCVVFNEINDGFKLSVRSCVKEVDASELASFLTENIGSGGGHYEKAGGFVSRKLYEERYPTLHAEAYFNNRMTQYFDSFDLIYAEKYDMDISNMKKYTKKNIPIGYVKTAEVLPVGTPITIRTLEGDMEMKVEEDLYILIGIKGEVYPNRREKFERSYKTLDQKYRFEDMVLSRDYIPTIKNRDDGSTLLITDYAKVCVPTGQVHIHAKELKRGVKVFTAWDKERYMLGKAGDYLAVRCEDRHDIYVVERDIFGRTYEESI